MSRKPGERGSNGCRARTTGTPVPPAATGRRSCQPITVLPSRPTMGNTWFSKRRGRPRLTRRSPLSSKPRRRVRVRQLHHRAVSRAVVCRGPPSKPSRTFQRLGRSTLYRCDPAYRCGQGSRSRPLRRFAALPADCQPCTVGCPTLSRVGSVGKLPIRRLHKFTLSRRVRTQSCSRWRSTDVRTRSVAMFVARVTATFRGLPGPVGR